jgi:Cu(I)/Ag(I) efflux system membrane fusion protein
VELPSEEGGVYEARTVRLGARLGDVYPVVAGLTDGERIVTRGAFALDADLQIRGGNSMMASPDDTQPGKWDTAIAVPRASLRSLSPVVVDYLALQRALAADDLAKAQRAASALQASTKDASLKASADAEQAWAQFAESMDMHARHVAQSNSLEQARKAFELLSRNVVMMLRVLGNPLDKPLVQAHCPMAAGSDGASWVQEGEQVNNSYFGAAMLDCGDVTDHVEPGAHLSFPDDESTQTSPKPEQGHEH